MQSFVLKNRQFYPLLPLHHQCKCQHICKECLSIIMKIGLASFTLRITALKCIPALYLILIPPILSDVLPWWQKTHTYFTLYSFLTWNKVWLDSQVKAQKPNQIFNMGKNLYMCNGIYNIILFSVTKIRKISKLLWIRQRD